MSAFFLYSQAMRSTVKEENPEASFGEVVRAVVQPRNDHCGCFIVVWMVVWFATMVLLIWDRF